MEEAGSVTQDKSFPSGHAATGFYVVTPYFVFRKRSRKLAILFLLAGLSWGSLMGLGRMIQGAHFLTDVVWSGGIVYLSGLVLYYVFDLAKERSTMLIVHKAPEVIPGSLEPG